MHWMPRRRLKSYITCLLLIVFVAFFSILVRLHYAQQLQTSIVNDSALLSFKQSQDFRNATTIITSNSGGGVVTKTIFRRAGNHSSRSSSSLTRASSHHVHRPPLSSLIDTRTNRITGNVQFLLDFAIVGFGKCGTSTLMHLLAQHDQVACFRQEIWELIHSRPVQLVELLYHGQPALPQLQRGYKCPAEITEPHILEYYRKHWPQTKLIVGIRHPVKWFQSLYNFRVQNLPDGATPIRHPNLLIGRCYKGMQLICTEKANFAAALLRLGKQNGPVPQLANTTLRQQSTASAQLVESIVGQFNKTWFNVSQVLYHPNPVFLYETGQLSDADFEPEFRHDLQAFLNLSSPILGPIPSYKPGMSWTNASVQAAKDALKIDICRAEYLPVRTELMRLAKLTSEWIVSEFMHYPTVSVSGRVRFERIMNGWKRDPCVAA